MSSNDYPKILGVRVDPWGWKEILDFCRAALEAEGSRQIVTVNGEFILEAQKNDKFKEVINNADLCIADSTNVFWAGRYKGIDLKEITPGVDLMAKLCQMAEKARKSVFLLGGKDDVAEKTGKKLAMKFPDLYVIGASNADPDNKEIITEVAKLKPDIIFVAYGSPTQELWIAEHKKELNAKILIGVGGAFDMISGNLSRAPKWLRSLHLEWLWRFFLQPTRVKRIINAVFVFPFKVIFYH